jgi:zinc transporter ZupT
MSGILAGLGAILGATTYKIVENKSTMAKVLAFIISTVLCILYLYLIAKNLKVK